MRELALAEIEHVSGGEDDAPRTLPGVTTVGTRIPSMDPWEVRQTIDALERAGLVSSILNQGNGGGGVGGSNGSPAENNDDEEHTSDCESLASDVASAEGLVNIYEDLLRDQYGPPSVSEIIVDGRDAGPDAVLIANLQAWHAAFSAELAEAQDALADAGC